MGLDLKGGTRKMPLMNAKVSLKKHGEVFLLKPAQKAELYRRVAEYEKNPDDVVSWEEIKRGLQKRFPLTPCAKS
jgi:putative addiction module component (TIGR02574 family)